MTDWKSDLRDFFNNTEKKAKDNEEKLEKVEAKVKEFYSKIIIPAFEELEKELQKYKRETKISSKHNSSSIIVSYRGEQEIEYEIQVVAYPHATSLNRITHFRDKDGKKCISEGPLQSNSQTYSITNMTKGEVITDFLSTYKDHLKHP